MRLRERLCARLLVALLAFSGASHCARGELGDAQAEELAAFQFALSLLRANGTLSLRFYDGGTDGLNQFTAGGSPFVLSGANYLELERLELLPQTGLPLLFESGLPETAGSSLLGGTHAHSESPGGGRVPVAVPLGQSVLFLSAGTTGHGVDSGGRPYFALEVPLQLPAAAYESVTLHVRKAVMAGTVAGNAFAVLRSSPLDVRATLRCAAAMRAGSTFTMRLAFNYSLFFSTLGSADASGAGAALNAAHTSTAFLQEHECFVL